MKLLVAHNAYIHSGGEEACVKHELQALREAGQDVRFFSVENRADTDTRLNALKAPWGKGNEQSLEDQLRNDPPDILHAHNLYPLLSARVFSAAKALGIKTVLTLHNYRPLCLNGLFLTPDHEICERCAGHTFGPGITRSCYRDSQVQSLYLAAHLTWAKWKEWYEAVDLFIAPTVFLRDKFVSYGFPADRIHVQGHFLPTMTVDAPSKPERYLLYLGRLSEEKGVRWLLQTFKTPSLPLTLRIAGDGPLREEVKSAGSSNIRYEDFVQGPAKETLIKNALAVVMPSRCYENFPVTVMEANAWGVPVVVSDLGGLSEMVQSGENGMAFDYQETVSFWRAIERYAEQEPMDARKSCQNYARAQFSRVSFLRDRLKLYETLLTKRV